MVVVVVGGGKGCFYTICTHKLTHRLQGHVEDLGQIQEYIQRGAAPNVIIPSSGYSLLHHVIGILLNPLPLL
jgi:hypothetical protein